MGLYGLEFGVFVSSCAYVRYVEDEAFIDEIGKFVHIETITGVFCVSVYGACI